MPCVFHFLNIWFGGFYVTWYEHYYAYIYFFNLVARNSDTSMVGSGNAISVT
jgi:hypothetical protein